MDVTQRLAAAEYEALDPATTFLNTATCGLPPARTAVALRAAVDACAGGRPPFDEYERSVAAGRAAFARIVSTPVDRVAIGHSVAGAAGRIAVQLPTGAEVLTADGDFSSLVNPFSARGDLRVRSVPLDDLPGAVRPGTALVAVSAVQSADGRVADLPALRSAAAEYGARTLVDATQAVGWLPLRATDYDYLLCGTYKWLLGMHGVSFLTVRESAQDGVSPVLTGWYSGEDPWDACYGPVRTPAASARRFDVSPAYLGSIACAASLSLIEELGIDAVHAHDTALATRFRAGIADLGRTAAPPGAAPSAIVAVPGLGSAAAPLTAAGLQLSARAGNLRFAFHLHNTAADVDHALDLLERATR